MTVWVVEWGNIYEGTYGFELFGTRESADLWAAEKEKSFVTYPSYYVDVYDKELMQ